MEEADERWREQLVDEGLEDHTKRKARDFLGEFGDSVQERVDRCLSTAEELISLGHASAALIRAITASELTIRWLVLRPLFAGAFLADYWAELLQTRIFRRSSSDDRKLFFKLMQTIGFNVDQMKSNDGKQLWQTFTQVVDVRNAVVHEGADASMEDARSAIAVARQLGESIVGPLAIRFGLSWPQRPWHSPKAGVGGGDSSGDYDQLDAFARK